MAFQKTILIVDDDPVILDSVTDIVRLAGYRTLGAGNGREALEVLEQHQPDVIVADVMMPEMDGNELYRAVRQNPAWLSIPFIFLTARGEKADIRRALSMGADHYLTKPFEPEDLLVAIQSRLERIDGLRAANQAEVDKTKKRLLDVFGHELRTPLSTIYGGIGLLQEEQDNLEPGSIESILHMMQTSTDRLVHLVEDLMQMVSIDTGVTAIEISRYSQPTDISYEIQQAVRDLSGEASRRNVNLTVSVPKELLVLGVPAHLNNIFRRLIDNAIKFSKKEGGNVWIKAAADAEQRLAVVTVTDDGIGIAEERQPELFETLHQIDRDRMEQQGVGIGLALASNLVRLHKGTIEVESRLGEGSTFSVTLPLHRVVT